MEDLAIQIITIVLEWSRNVEQSNLNWYAKLSKDHWSPIEILGHLTDSAHINLERLIRCTYESDFRLVYDQNKWVTTRRYQQEDLTDIMTLWIILNKQISTVLARYSKLALEICCDIGQHEMDLQPISVIAEDYLNHLKQHLKQINKYIQ